MDERCYLAEIGSRFAKKHVFIVVAFSLQLLLLSLNRDSALEHEVRKMCADVMFKPEAYP